MVIEFTLPFVIVPWQVLVRPAGPADAMDSG
jgi:hypothetical protein